MLTLTSKSESNSIAKIGKKFLTINEDKGENAISVSSSAGTQFQMIPNYTRNRVMYITGASGSGKSYYIRSYAKEYKNKYKNNRIWLLSAIQDNTDFKSVGAKQLNPSKLMNLDMEKLVEAVSNSLIIFDDIDVMNKADRTITYSILNKMLEIGRHKNCTICVSNHLATSGLDTRRILNESGSITFFMNNYNKSLRYLLENYLGLEKDTISKLKKSKSRWITCFRHYPMVVMTQTEAFLPNAFEEIKKKTTE
jgi:hypothetical protein